MPDTRELKITWADSAERDLWMREYQLSRQGGLSVMRSCDEADRLVAAVRQRVGASPDEPVKAITITTVGEPSKETIEALTRAHKKAGERLAHHLWTETERFSGRPVSCRRCDAVCDDSNRDASCPGRS